MVKIKNRQFFLHVFGKLHNNDVIFYVHVHVYKTDWLYSTHIVKYGDRVHVWVPPNCLVHARTAVTVQSAVSIHSVRIA